MLFTDVSYLKTGTAKQQKVHQLLSDIGIMDKLSTFDPVLAGTIPIGIDTDNSDLDIICYWQDPRQFKSALVAHFSSYQDFQLTEQEVRCEFSIIGSFSINDFNFEVFGQNVPSTAQHAYLHMVKEHEVLQAKGEWFRRAIIDLKKKGIHTESAFAQLLGLSGDPYLALLELKIPDLSK